MCMEKGKEQAQWPEGSERSHLVCCEGVQTGSWLIKEQHPGVGYEGKADVGALALPTCTFTCHDAGAPCRSVHILTTHTVPKTLNSAVEPCGRCDAY